MRSFTAVLQCGTFLYLKIDAVRLELMPYVVGSQCGVSVQGLFGKDSKKKKSGDCKEHRWTKRQFNVGKRECFICKKVDESDDREFVRCPSTSVESNCDDQAAAIVNGGVSAFNHSKIRRCGFPSCAFWFHENCFLVFTE
ncbi:unnamed protein product, partial [Litomosoides sigmodontis]